MSTAKTATLTFRSKPSLKAALRIAAERGHSSFANIVEVMVRDDYRRNGITIPELGSLFDEEQKPTKGGK